MSATVAVEAVRNSVVVVPTVDGCNFVELAAYSSVAVVRVVRSLVEAAATVVVVAEVVVRNSVGVVAGVATVMVKVMTIVEVHKSA